MPWLQRHRSISLTRSREERELLLMLRYQFAATANSKESRARKGCMHCVLRWYRGHGCQSLRRKPTRFISARAAARAAQQRCGGSGATRPWAP